MTLRPLAAVADKDSARGVGLGRGVGVAAARGAGVFPLVVLKDGAALFAGPAADVIGARSGGLTVRPERVEQLEIVERIAQTKGYAVTRSDDTLHVAAPGDFAAALNRSCMAAGVTLVELHSVQATLEESFLTMIEGGA